MLRVIPKTQAVGAAAITELLSGPVGGELTADPAMFTDIPSDARFLGLTIDNGVATVNLSGEFAAGGTSATINQRYGQVVYTLTQFPTVKSVLFQVDGVARPAVLQTGPIARAATRSRLRRPPAPDLGRSPGVGRRACQSRPDLGVGERLRSAVPDPAADGRRGPRRRPGPRRLRHRLLGSVRRHAAVRPRRPPAGERCGSSRSRPRTARGSTSSTIRSGSRRRGGTDAARLKPTLSAYRVERSADLVTELQVPIE